jgi:hypothetical protein
LSKGGILKLLRSPESISKNPFHHPSSPLGQYDNPIPTQFLAPIDCLKIPAQASIDLGNPFRSISKTKESPYRSV